VLAGHRRGKQGKIDTAGCEYVAFLSAEQVELDFCYDLEQVRSKAAERKDCKLANSISTEKFKPVRIGRLGQRVIVGIDRRYDMQSRSAIPTQWATYSAIPGHERGMMQGGYYGVCHSFGDDGSFGYLCGMQLAKGETQPEGLTGVTVPAGNYAKFVFPVHISQMPLQWDRIMGEWLPGSGYEMTDGPNVEFYSPAFNGVTGEGGFEIWIPVRKKT